MGLFSRRSRSDDADAQRAAISGFWSWWRDAGASDTAAALADGEPGRTADEIGAHVAAIHPALGWEFAPGLGSLHVLVLSREGNPQLRAVARRWRRAAPDADETWQYADARQPAVDPAAFTVELDGARIHASEVTVSARVSGTSLDVALFHPALADLPAERRTAAVFLLLDHVVGEADVETWIGSIEALTLAPLDPIPLLTLPVVVHQLRERHTDAQGRPSWVLLEGRTPGGLPVVASAQVPLTPATAAQLDAHVAVAVPFTDRTDGGLPGPSSLQPLRDFEDHLTRRLGDSGRLVAHQTSGGMRLLHFYVDTTTPAADQLRAAVGGWDQGAVRIQVEYDPSWEAVAHLRG